MSFDAYEPGPAAMADFDQDREQAIQKLREATHGFAVSTAYLDADGDPAYTFFAQINPNDRSQMSVGWTAGWYHAMIGHLSRVFRLALRRGIENRIRFEDGDE